MDMLVYLATQYIALFSAASVQSKEMFLLHSNKKEVYFWVIEVDNKHLHRFVGSHMLLHDLCMSCGVTL